MLVKIKSFQKWVLLSCAWIYMVLIPAAKPAFADVESHSQPGLVVIAPEAWLDSLKPFMEHKQTLMPAQLVGLESVLKSNDGVDDPEKIKRFLHQQYSTQDVRYALLVGDVDIFPVRYMVLDRSTEPAFNFAFYPSDLYYSDLLKRDGKSFEDWNSSRAGFHAGYFGEVRGEHNKQDPINYDRIDYLPELAVGRWPVRTLQQLQTVIKKTMLHDSRSTQRTPNQPPRLALYAVGGWVDSRPIMDFAAANLAHWESNKRYYTDDGKPANPQISNASLRSDFANGVDLVFHAGHGTQHGWDQCLGMEDLALLDNTTRLPVVMSVGCSTAHFAPEPPYMSYTDVFDANHTGTNNGETFDAPPPPPNPYQKQSNSGGLGESMLQDGAGGAVAYIGCCTGSQPCGLTLIKGFSDALKSNKPARLGDIWNHAIRYYYRTEKLDELKPTDDWYPPSIYFQGMKFIVFGDPTLTLPGSSVPLKMP